MNITDIGQQLYVEPSDRVRFQKLLEECDIDYDQEVERMREEQMASTPMGGGAGGPGGPGGEGGFPESTCIGGSSSPSTRGLTFLMGTPPGGGGGGGPPEPAGM